MRGRTGLRTDVLGNPSISLGSETRRETIIAAENSRLARYIDAFIPKNQTAKPASAVAVAHPTDPHIAKPEYDVAFVR